MELEELVNLRPECPICRRKLSFLYGDIEGTVIFLCKSCKRTFVYKLIEEKLIRVD